MILLEEEKLERKNNFLFFLFFAGILQSKIPAFSFKIFFRKIDMV
jgi:hypothetical protein